MPTYNGTSIITGTLYEDGSITVKSGFKVITDMVSLPILGSLDTKKKLKIQVFDVGTNNIDTVGIPVLNDPLGTKKKLKILLLDTEVDQVSLPSILNMSMTKKSVIIVP